MTECQFADDAALLATTRAGAEQAMLSYIDVAGALGLSINLAIYTEDQADSGWA